MYSRQVFCSITRGSAGGAPPMAHAPVALEEDSGEATTHDPPVDLSAVDRLLLIKALGRACGSLGSTDAELRRDLAAELSTEAVAARLNIQRLDELFTIEQAHTVFRYGSGFPMRRESGRSES